MRHLIPLLLFASPAAAWEFSPIPICTLTHTTDAAEFTITYDASLPEYALTLTLLQDTWPDSPTFGMQFAGPNPIAIGTDRHVTDGARLTVKDSGFGNVLNGLQFNDRATATAGPLTITADLADAGAAVAAFRRCPAPATS
ncbi:excinuclease ABC subunit B [Yoonia sp. R2331]|uniref:excinuclease ABC subunit B n=1 Tax=Yoonia sp. R2331 TaxID=3237238 RepID=UPI0034E42118